MLTYQQKRDVRRCIREDKLPCPESADYWSALLRAGHRAKALRINQPIGLEGRLALIDAMRAEFGERAMPSATALAILEANRA